MAETPFPSSDPGGSARTWKPRATDVFIAVMGVTGAGKSTLIKLCTDREVEVGDGLSSCTQDVAVYAYDYSATTTVYMVDTPGFDDGERSDAEVLATVAAWLTESYANDLKLSGIIYLHRILDNRLGGSALRNLMMFKQLCGQDALSNVILVTNMWEQIAPEIGMARENELTKRQDYWGFMISQGSQVFRHYNTRESAKRLIDIYASRVSRISPKPLQLQVDMIDNDLALGETGAGRAVDAGLAREMEKLQQELQSTKTTLQKAIDNATAQALSQYQKDTADRMRSIEKERESLQMNAERLHKEQFAKLEDTIKAAKADNDKIRESLAEAKQDLENQRKRQEEEREQAEQQRQTDLRALQEVIDANRQAREEELAREAAQQVEAERERVAVAAAQTKFQNELMEEEIYLTKLHSGDRTLSTVLTNRINEFVSVAITGNRYYFCGPARNLCWPPSLLEMKSTNRKVRYVALGTDLAYYQHSHDFKGECHTTISQGMRLHYNSLTRWMDSEVVDGCPTCVSLGKNGHYFANVGGSRHYNLPLSIHNRIDSYTSSTVKYLWLGYNDAFVAVTEGGSIIWDLKARYSGLGNLLYREKDRGRKLKALAMSLDNGGTYFAVFDDGYAVYYTDVLTIHSIIEDYAFKEFSRLNCGQEVVVDNIGNNLGIFDAFSMGIDRSRYP